MAKKLNSNAGRAKAVRKDNGVITHILFEHRTKMMPLKQAINKVKDGNTIGLRVNQTGDGREYLQDKPDSSTEDNLENLPEK